MIKPKYGVKCLHLGFDRYKRYCKLPVTVKPSSTTISFYVEKPSTPKGKNARVSNHHPNIQHYTDDGRQPWLTDNISIEFIVPRSKEDKKRYRARVEQNASGTIQPFDVTTYQYDSTMIDPTDITTIFKAIIVFLNGGGYTDPFIGTPKQAKVLPRHSNIKPHRGSASSTTLTCSRNIGIDDNYLNEMTIYCLGDIIPLNENKQYNKNRNMKQTIKLSESELKRMIAESVENILMEDEIEEVTVDPRWWRKDGELPDMKGGTYRKPKQIKVSEAQLRQIVKESIEQVLNEVSPEYYTNAANTAQNSINGFKGKMMKTFMPKQYNKRQRQATQFRDMSNDHPQDEWEITNQQMGSNPYDAQTYYTLRNTRTGEQRGYNDGNKEKPFRGRVIAGQGGDNESASWLNNKQYNPSHR